MSSKNTIYYENRINKLKNKNKELINMLFTERKIRHFYEEKYKNNEKEKENYIKLMKNIKTTLKKTI